MPQPYNQVADKYTMYLPQGRHRATFSHFERSGIDVFSSPNSTNPDGFLNLDDVLPVMNGGFQRRWGTTSLGNLISGFASGDIARMFPYQVSAEGSVAGDYYSGFGDYYSIFATDNQIIKAIYNESSNDGQSITGFSGTGDVYATTSRDFMYAFDGVGAPQKKQFAVTTDTQTPIGIDINFSTTGSPIQGIVGTGLYSTVPTASVVTSTGSSATIGLGVAGPDNNGNYTIAGATVITGGSGYAYTDTIAISGTVVSLGYLTPTFYNGALVAVVINGPMTFNVGRVYAIALQNSKTGHTSGLNNFDVSPLSYFPAKGVSYTDSSGNQQTVLPLGCTQIQLKVSTPSPTDPQVDTVVLLATSDGGDQEHFYEVTTFPLSTFIPDPDLAGNVYVNYTDTTPDGPNDFALTNGYSGGTLLTNNLWVDVDPYGDVIGIFQNAPPPTTLNKPVTNQGRMFATDGKSVFFSKSIDEVTTSTGLITSKWEEAWPATNRLDIGFDNELITGLLSDTTFLYIGTTQNIYRLTGTGANSFSIQCLFRNVGLLNQDCWSIVYKAFMPAGYMWVTPDLKIMFSDFNTYKDVGIPIYPLLAGISSPFIQPWTHGPYAMAMLKSSLDDIYVFNLDAESWYRWTPDIDTGPLLTYTQSSGLANPFFIENVSTPVLGYFDPTATKDAFPNANTPISWLVRTGWQDLGDITGPKVINEMEIWSEETSLTTTVYTSTGALDSPVTNTRTAVAAPTAAMKGLYKAYYAGANTGGKLFSFAVSCPGSSTISEVLDQFTVEFYPFGRF